MKIEVVGVGCARCRSLSKHVQEAAEAVGVDYQLAQVSDLNEIISRGIISTPTLVVDGTVALSGRSASAKELEKLLREIVAKTPSGDPTP